MRSIARALAVLLAFASGVCAGCDPKTSRSYVFVLAPSFSSEEAAVVSDAAAHWEAAVARPDVFAASVVQGECDSFTGDPTAEIVCVDYATSAPGGTEGETAWDSRTRRQHVSLNVDNGAKDAVRRATLSHEAQHELGHAFGLGHETDRRCVMFPKMSTSLVQSGLAAQNVTEADVAAFARAWGLPGPDDVSHPGPQP